MSVLICVKSKHGCSSGMIRWTFRALQMLKCSGLLGSIIFALMSYIQSSLYLNNMRGQDFTISLIGDVFLIHQNIIIFMLRPGLWPPSLRTKFLIQVFIRHHIWTKHRFMTKWPLIRHIYGQNVALQGNL